MLLEFSLAFIVTLLVSVGFAILMIPMLRRFKAEQSIRKDGPVWHNKKQGTPTMGGFIFIIAISLTCFTVGLPKIINGNLGHLFILSFALIFGAIGFYDDYIKVKNKRNLGLKTYHKFLLQTAVAVGYLILLYNTGNLTTSLYIPFVNDAIPIYKPLYFVFAAFVMVGTVNSVNITDGVDGLAAGVTIPVAACFSILTWYWGFTTVGIFSFALTGALIGFLIFNFHPAKVIMGDT